MGDTVTRCMPRPRYLLERQNPDWEQLVVDVKQATSTSLASNTPTSRFRGTLIVSTGEGFRVVGWQRNVARLQGMDVSYPTIITLALDQAGCIQDIALDPCFKGSKGLLCDASYLNDNLRSALCGSTIDEQFFTKMQVAALQCFHLVEVVGGIVSGLEILRERGGGYLAEDEVIDAYESGRDLVVTGRQRMSFAEEEVHYSMVFQDVYECVRFDTKGMICSDRPFSVQSYLGDIPICRRDLSGKRGPSVCQELKTLGLELLEHIKPVFVRRAREHSFMCSNLFPQAFIGLMVQMMSMRLYYNNVNYVLHCLSAFQRFRDVPRCIGAVRTLEEARVHFPKFDVASVF